MTPNEKNQTADPHNLQRFVDAQAGVYARVCAELRQGRKTSHWMWFIFPQLKGLGHSQMAEHFGISSLDEARAYLQHGILGERLRECTQLVLAIKQRRIEEIFGSPDDMKFRSCITLFAQASTANEIFVEAIQKYFHGEFDERTLELLK